MNNIDKIGASGINNDIVKGVIDPLKEDAYIDPYEDFFAEENQDKTLTGLGAGELMDPAAARDKVNGMMQTVSETFKVNVDGGSEFGNTRGLVS